MSATAKRIEFLARAIVNRLEDRGLMEFSDAEAVITVVAKALGDNFAAVAGHALLVHAEVGRAMDDELVELLKRAGIEEQRDALARGELAVVVLPVDASLAATDLAVALAALELFHVFLE